MAHLKAEIKTALLERYDKGIAQRIIADELNALGYSTSGGMPWSQTYVSIYAKKYGRRRNRKFIKRGAQSREAQYQVNPQIAEWVVNNYWKTLSLEKRVELLFKE